MRVNKKGFFFSRKYSRIYHPATVTITMRHAVLTFNNLFNVKCAPGKLSRYRVYARNWRVQGSNPGWEVI